MHLLLARRFSSAAAKAAESGPAAAHSLARDHRIIGQRQHLFMLHPCSPGSAFILPHGERILGRLRRLLRQEYRDRGYHEVSTPLLYHTDLWHQSGHWQNYRGDMFQVHGDLHDGADAAAIDSTSDSTSYSTSYSTSNSDGERDPAQHPVREFGLKPMNCPAHCLIFQHSSRSYRDMPLRLADFSALHRNELSGTLTGLTRLRQFHQDDAHIFCRMDQVQQEIRSTLEMIHRLYHQVFHFPNYRLALSTRPANSDGCIGRVEEWETAESLLHSAIEDHLKRNYITIDTTTTNTLATNSDINSNNLYDIKSGDGAFYGPKIDLQVTDSHGRFHQLATIQLDFQLPERFQLNYTNREGNPERPVLIHRAALGSLERFWAVWMEECGGRWPFWCSPRQVLVIPHSAGGLAVQQYADQLADRLQRRPDGRVKYWVDVDRTEATLAKKVRNGEQMAYNYMLVIGKREMDSQRLAVRKRDAQTTEMSLEDFCLEMDRLSDPYNI